MTTHAALIAEAEQALEGITPEPWFLDTFAAQGGAPIISAEKWARGNSRHVAKVLYQNGSEDPEVHHNAAFIAWAGNGGARRLVEDNKALVGKLREAEFENRCSEGGPMNRAICQICNEETGTSHADDCPFAVLNEEASDAD